MTNVLVDAAAEAFAAELVRWRADRKLSKKQLAADMGFDPSYVSHVEARRHRPTEDFARRAEAVLQAGGVIWQRFRDYDDARQSMASATSPPRPRSDPLAELRFAPPAAPPVGSPAASLVAPHDEPRLLAGLVVEHEQSELSYQDGSYRCVVRRALFNAGAEPVTRYLVRIAVDRYPGEPERSNRHYRDHPLTWAELNLDARRGDEPMTWRSKHDRDAFKEVWLLFENDDGRFPLYPGQRTTIEYAYTVGEDKWGHWFQRAVRLPTRRLSVQLDFPARLRPVVWGVETSLTAEAGALKSPVVERHVAGVDGSDRIHFDWSTDDPALNARFRLGWRFRAEPPREPRPRGPESRPSDLMRGVGIVQRGAPMLDRAARQFDLPEQATLAEDVIARLLDALHRVEQLHTFGKGVGLAAPQIGIDWAAAVARAPEVDGGAPIILLNPRIVGESVDQDEQYEGCLSFFDERGLVARPLIIEVEHDDLTGQREQSTFSQGLARLVAHEVDHLAGFLYPDRMPPDRPLIPVEDYHEHGQAWRY